MDWSGLIEKALEGMERAYAPYSGFRVGAALLGENGVVYTAAMWNLAHIPPPSARNALLWSRRSARESGRFLRWRWFPPPGADADYTSPCGVCRQMLFEFCKEDMPVILAKSKEDYQTTTLGQLFPMGFGPDKLGKEKPVCG